MLLVEVVKFTTVGRICKLVNFMYTHQLVGSIKVVDVFHLLQHGGVTKRVMVANMTRTDYPKISTICRRWYHDDNLEVKFPLQDGEVHDVDSESRIVSYTKIRKSEKFSSSGVIFPRSILRVSKSFARSTY